MNAVQLTLLLLCCAPQAMFTQSNSLFSICYEESGLTRVEITNGQLHYTWHTERQWGNGALAPASQDMSNFDRHEATIWLTPAELTEFQHWEATNHLARWHTPFPARSGAPSYGSAFRSTLTIVSGGSRQKLAWNRDNTVPPELTAAVQQLIRLCRDIEGRRRKQP